MNTSVDSIHSKPGELEHYLLYPDLKICKRATVAQSLNRTHQNFYQRSSSVSRPVPATPFMQETPTNLQVMAASNQMNQTQMGFGQSNKFCNTKYPKFQQISRQTLKFPTITSPGSGYKQSTGTFQNQNLMTQCHTLDNQQLLFTQDSFFNQNQKVRMTTASIVSGETFLNQTSKEEEEQTVIESPIKYPKDSPLKGPWVVYNKQKCKDQVAQSIKGDQDEPDVDDTIVQSQLKNRRPSYQPVKLMSDLEEATKTVLKKKKMSMGFRPPNQNNYNHTPTKNNLPNLPISKSSKREYKQQSSNYDFMNHLLQEPRNIDLNHYIAHLSGSSHAQIIQNSARNRNQKSNLLSILNKSKDNTPIDSNQTSKKVLKQAINLPTSNHFDLQSDAIKAQHFDLKRQSALLLAPYDPHQTYLNNNVIKPKEFNDTFAFQMLNAKTFAIDVGGLALPLEFVTIGVHDTSVYFSAQSNNKKPNSKHHDFKMVNQPSFTWPLDYKEKTVVKKLPPKFIIYLTIETTTACSVQCALKQNPKVKDLTVKPKLSKEEEAQAVLRNEPDQDLPDLLQERNRPLQVVGKVKAKLQALIHYGDKHEATLSALSSMDSLQAKKQALFDLGQRNFKDENQHIASHWREVQFMRLNEMSQVLQVKQFYAEEKAKEQIQIKRDNALLRCSYSERRESLRNLITERIVTYNDAQIRYATWMGFLIRHQRCKSAIKAMIDKKEYAQWMAKSMWIVLRASVNMKRQLAKYARTSEERQRRSLRKTLLCSGQMLNIHNESQAGIKVKDFLERVFKMQELESKTKGFIAKIKNLQSKFRIWIQVRHLQQRMIRYILKREHQRISASLNKAGAVIPEAGKTRQLLPWMRELTELQISKTAVKFHKKCLAIYNRQYKEWRDRTNLLRRRGFKDQDGGFYFPFLQSRVVHYQDEMIYDKEIKIWKEREDEIVEMQQLITEVLMCKFQYFMVSNDPAPLQKIESINDSQELEIKNYTEDSQPTSRNTSKQKLKIKKGGAKRMKFKVKKEQVQVLTASFQRQESMIARAGINRLGKLTYIPFPIRPPLKFIPDAETSHALIMATILDNFDDFKIKQESQLKSAYTSAINSPESSKVDLSTLN